MTLRRYMVKSAERPFGWAIVVIDSDGYFSTVSDYGNYSYGWWHHGRGDFREFLIDLEKDPGYAYGKLHHGKDPYDGGETLKAVKQYIKNARRGLAGYITRAHAREEWDRLEEHENLDNELAFHDWVRATDISDAWEFHSTSPEPQCWAFCTRVLPLLAEMLRAELQSEREAARG